MVVCNDPVAKGSRCHRLFAYVHNSEVLVTEKWVDLADHGRRHILLLIGLHAMLEILSQEHRHGRPHVTLLVHQDRNSLENLLDSVRRTLQVLNLRKKLLIDFFVGLLWSGHPRGIVERLSFSILPRSSA